MQMSRFINTELKSDSESSDSDSEKVDNELMTKLESGSHTFFLLKFSTPKNDA